MALSNIEILLESNSSGISFFQYTFILRYSFARYKRFNEATERMSCPQLKAMCKKGDYAPAGGVGGYITFVLYLVLILVLVLCLLPLCFHFALSLLCLLIILPLSLQYLFSIFLFPCDPGQPLIYMLGQIDQLRRLQL